MCLDELAYPNLCNRVEYTQIPIHFLAMKNETSKDTFQYWAETMNKRGYGGVFGRRDEVDKSIVENSVLQEWATSILEEWGTIVSNLCLRENDPPDADAVIDGEAVTIELKEFVDEKLLGDTTRDKAQGGPLTAYQGTGFERAQWTRDRFQQELSRRVDHWARKYSDSVQPQFDYLVLHTAEPWLMPQDVEAWTSKAFLPAQCQFKSVHLLMSYDPGYRPHWPIFRVN